MATVDLHMPQIEHVVARLARVGTLAAAEAHTTNDGRSSPSHRQHA
jgi:hypothetical protein